MTPKDNSRLTLSAYSDWLEEHNQLDLAENIREEITLSCLPDWIYENWKRSNYSWETGSHHEPGVGSYDQRAGNVIFPDVGCGALRLGSVVCRVGTLAGDCYNNGVGGAG